MLEGNFEPSVWAQDNILWSLKEQSPRIMFVRDI